MSHSDGNLILKDAWKPFNIVTVGSETRPRVHQRHYGSSGDIVVVAGCITAVNPMKNQAGWDLVIANLPTTVVCEEDFSFLAPMSMSRFEGVFQCGTSVRVKAGEGGKITIFFTKTQNPMVLHIYGLAFVANSLQEPTLLNFTLPTQKQGGDVEDDDDADFKRPSWQRCGDIVFLQGVLEEATYGPKEKNIAQLPSDLLPWRDLRFLGVLIKPVSEEEPDLRRIVDQSIGINIRKDGSIWVVGGQMRMNDNKGNTKVLPQHKKGRLCFDGIRYALHEGVNVDPGAQLETQAKKKEPTAVQFQTEKEPLAVAVKQDDIVVLEGKVTWKARNVNFKQPLAQLPRGHWPRSREVFYTRGADTQERRRVDIDEYGRVFCPEGVDPFRLELTGIIFVAAEPSDKKPANPDWDDLKLTLHKNESNTFGGRERLKEFVERSNHTEWEILKSELKRNAQREVLLPLGTLNLRGRNKWDPSNLGQQHAKYWELFKDTLERCGLHSLQTMYHVSPNMFEQLCNKCKVQHNEKQQLQLRREELARCWDRQRASRISFAQLQGLADEIVTEMFEHWDIHAQIKAVLQSDFRPPASIEHLFPQKASYDKYLHGKIKPEEQEKFEQIRQFFLMYETTGNKMTHCSLMGAQDSFTTTGKWYFPDVPEVQRQLFENVAWLFPKNIHLYFSERQAPRFPFIEDLDVQCKTDWEGPRQPNENPRPPDSLIMDFPQRIGQGKFDVKGNPGTLMVLRAQAIHMLYPDIERLRCNVYSASGYNKGKDKLKSSFHLVWPQLIVDPDRAPVVREVTLAKFALETKKGGMMMKRHNRLLELDESNNWELFFDSTTIHARNGLRLPYSDKASSVIATEEDKKKVEQKLLSKSKAPKRRVRENRPSKAVGIIEFVFKRNVDGGGGEDCEGTWVADKDSHTIAEWIAMGTCRRDPHNPPELTPWQLGPDVLKILPKTADAHRLEGQDTHKPFPNIRIYDKGDRDPELFKLEFDEALDTERDCLEESQTVEDENLRQRLNGSWIQVDQHQALWRTLPQPAGLYVRDRLAPRQQRARRQSEVWYNSKTAKVIATGPPEMVEVLIRVLSSTEGFTKADDNPIMPLIDIGKLSATPKVPLR
eukprot:CAMPEP_0178464116 /NCGR_PEP_ID=MMETSP0689_2-20121128/50678_1 /TAXON_ID=160604 /ORGANISM="Amphidinium massartii, Strain CS-259" /LENGTH=1109 /DNA_ID=CAMNT_0020091011 /DNA_START=121 /DNA_END=3451 /DNA_ORIENTATION=+